MQDSANTIRPVVEIQFEIINSPIEIVECWNNGFW